MVVLLRGQKNTSIFRPLKFHPPNLVELFFFRNQLASIHAQQKIKSQGVTRNCQVSTTWQPTTAKEPRKNPPLWCLDDAKALTITVTHKPAVVSSRTSLTRLGVRGVEAPLLVPPPFLRNQPANKEEQKKNGKSGQKTYIHDTHVVCFCCSTPPEEKNESTVIKNHILFFYPLKFKQFLFPQTCGSCGQLNAKKNQCTNPLVNQHSWLKISPCSIGNISTQSPSPCSSYAMFSVFPG